MANTIKCKNLLADQQLLPRPFGEGSPTSSSSIRLGEFGLPLPHMYHTCRVLDFKKQPPYIFHSRTIANIQDHHNVRVPDVPYHIASSLRARLEACIASTGRSRHRRRRWPTSCSSCLRRALRKGGVGWIGRYV